MWLQHGDPHPRALLSRSFEKESRSAPAPVISVATMALLMPDINLRRAKHHLERYWRRVLGGEKPEERKRLTFRFKSDRMSPSKVAQQSAEGGSSGTNGVGNLDRKMESNDVTEGSLDCWSARVVENQDEKTGNAGDSDEVEQKQPHAEQDAAVHNWKPTTTVPDAKPTVNRSASSTSTVGSYSSSGSNASTSSVKTCVDKPPLPASRGHRGSYPPSQMPKPTCTPLAEGPTLGSIMHRVYLNDGDVRELDFSSLALRKKRLESDGCALVARSLTTNHTVRTLVIRDHAIGDNGAVALSKMLCNNTTLQSLDLYGNGITDRGAEVLAQALYGHDSLTHLSLRGNGITDRGAEAIAQAVRCNCMLKSIELQSNRITRVGAQALLDALDVNFHLEALALDANDVPPSIASQLAASLARNRAEALILESQAAEEMAENFAWKVDRDFEEDTSSDDEGDEDEYWESDDDDNSVSSGFLSCSGVTDIPLSSSGLWI